MAGPPNTTQIPPTGRNVKPVLTGEGLPSPVHGSPNDLQPAGTQHLVKKAFIENQRFARTFGVSRLHPEASEGALEDPRRPVEGP